MRHVWEEGFDFPVKLKSLVHGTIEVTISTLDRTRGSLIEVGSEQFQYPLLYYNGHGIKDHFFIYRDNLAIGRLLLSTSFENYAPGDIEPELGPKELNPKDSLLMDEEETSQKRRKKVRHEGSKSRRSKKNGENSSSVEKPGWNDRFWVDSVVNNDSATHPHYKVYTFVHAL